MNRKDKLIVHQLLDYDLLKDDCEEITKVASLSDAKLRFRYPFFILNIIITAFTIGFSPEYFYYYWHSWKCVYLFVHHWFSFSKSWRNYFTDFCYFTNFLVLGYYWLPGWKPSFCVIFILSNGPLLFSIAMNASAVPHSTRKQTYVFMSISPVFATWGTRWFSYKEQLCSEPTVSGPNGCHHVNWIELLPWTMFFLAIWLCTYSILRQKYRSIERKYDYTPLMIKRAEEQLLYKFIVTNFKEKNYQLVYITIFISYYTFAIFSACIAYHRMIYGVIPITLMIIAASYNGGVFYIDLLKHYCGQHK